MRHNDLGIPYALQPPVRRTVRSFARVVWTGLLIAGLSAVAVDIDHVLFGSRAWHAPAVGVVILLLLCGSALIIASIGRQVWIGILRK